MYVVTMHRKLILLLLLLLPLGVAAKGKAKVQAKDTVLMVTGARLPVKVTGLKYDGLDRLVVFSPYKDEKGKTLDHIQGDLVDKITFHDGFTVQFLGGELLRDNLTEAPRYTYRQSGLQAEGVIPLTHEEIRMRLGDEVYEAGYCPYRRQALIGSIKAAVMLPLSLATYFYGNITVSRKEFADRKGYYLLTQASPFGNLSRWLAVTTGATGLAETMICSSRIGKLASHPESFRQPSLSASRWRVAAGSTLVLAGAGLMGYGYWRSGTVRLSQGYQKATDGGKDVLVSEIGRSPAAVWLWSLAGAAVLNVGASELTYGINCLHARSVLRNKGLDRLTVSFAPTPGGAAMSLCF